MDKFSYLIVALASAAPILNTDPSAVESQELMEEQAEVNAALDEFINRLKSTPKSLSLAKTKTSSVPKNADAGRGSGSENSNYEPDEDSSAEEMPAEVKTGAAAVSNVRRSPRKRPAPPTAAVEESPSKRKVRARTVAEQRQASPSKRKTRADVIVEARSPSKKRRTK